MLDTGPLGMLAHPLPNPDLEQWMEKLLIGSGMVIVPEIADYELRRELIRAGLSRSIERLNELESLLDYKAITTITMRRAAELWAQARTLGKPGADTQALDGDVILAALAEDAGAVVATDNMGHLELFVEARNWRDIL
jgi:predicted nucleic acid-binding protein